MAFIGTTEPLLGAAVFTDYAKSDDDSKVRGLVYSDQSGSLVISHSPDGVNWDVAETAIAVTGGAGKAVEFNLLGSYWKAEYTNGATPQTEFRLWITSYA